MHLLDSAQAGGGHPGLGQGPLPEATPCCHGLVQHGTTVSKRGWQKEGQSAGKKSQTCQEARRKKSHFAGECDRSSILPRRGNKAAIITSCVLHSPGTPSTSSAGSRQLHGMCPPRTALCPGHPGGSELLLRAPELCSCLGLSWGAIGGKGVQHHTTSSQGRWLPYRLHTLKRTPF